MDKDGGVRDGRGTVPPQQKYVSSSTLGSRLAGSDFQPGARWRTLGRQLSVPQPVVYLDLLAQNPKLAANWPTRWTRVYGLHAVRFELPNYLCSCLSNRGTLL